MNIKAGDSGHFSSSRKKIRETDEFDEKKSHTLQYCFVAKISYEPRQSSGRWYQSTRRPLWSRWLKYSVGTRMEEKENQIILRKMIW